MAALAGHLPTPEGPTGGAVNALRFLAVDAVERAESGHPGTAMALAPLAHALFTRHLRHDPADPRWPDRDRFVLSIGHASMLLYGALHLSGYDLPLDDLRRFRQGGSRAPGHPEPWVTPGVEAVTGPLGQGVANGVGMALAERMLAARFNRPGHAIVDHRTWVFAGDGDMMEGVAGEAASLAGHLRLGRLTVFYDDNRISLEGSTRLHFSEDVGTRFAGYGWQVLRLFDVADAAAIDEVVADAQADGDRPTLVIVHTHIGMGSPVVDTAAAHGAPLGEAGAASARRALGWPHRPFEIPQAVYDHWREGVSGRARARTEWLAAMDRYRTSHPELAAEHERVQSGRLPDGWEQAVPRFEPGARIATRRASGQALNSLAAAVPELVGGAADLAPSTLTYLHDGDDVGPRRFAGRNVHFGVREHAMGAILNGMAAHGGLRVYGATFFVFSDYLRPAIRLAALQRLPVVYVFTHDSIGLGEDGPTHQPVEHLASLRAMPGLRVVRPADANETAQAWAQALDHPGPTALVLSRQALPVLPPELVDVSSGASVLAPGDDAAIVATGSEVEVALTAAEVLRDEGVGARVVSLPSWEVFAEQDEAVRHRILPPGVPSVAVEAASPFGWRDLVDDVVALSGFGASAPAGVLYADLGITADAVAERVRHLLAQGQAAPPGAGEQEGSTT
ncbi:MAG: transketolase [Acidimicrobiia bacterium]